MISYILGKPKKIMIKGPLLKGERAERFMRALYCECEQKGMPVSAAGFLHKIIDIGLEDYLKVAEVNDRIKVAKAKEGVEGMLH